jgi:F-type H+-transporting ATPase subunit epsilon
LEAALMNLKILLPFRVFIVRNGVKRIVSETREGSFGLLPHRLDCVADLAPGLLCYETEDEGEVYVAIDEGILVKAGPEVLVSVRNAIGGTGPGSLRDAVKKEFLTLDEEQRKVRQMLAKLESGFIGSFMEFKNE